MTKTKEYTPKPFDSHIVIGYEAKDESGNQINGEVEGIGKTVIEAVYNVADQFKGKNLSSIKIVKGYDKRTSEKLSQMTIEDAIDEINFISDLKL